MKGRGRDLSVQDRYKWRVILNTVTNYQPL